MAYHVVAEAHGRQIGDRIEVACAKIRRCIKLVRAASQFPDALNDPKVRRRKAHIVRRGHEGSTAVEAVDRIETGSLCLGDKRGILRRDG